jgi:rSAM/selenodomain-associated transferase 1
MLRAPILGTVKSRLAAALGEAGALDAYKELLGIVFRRIGRLQGITLRVTPDDRADLITPWAQALARGYEIRPQGEGDLGTRMQRAFADAFAEGAHHVIMIGVDCPGLSADHIHGAWRKLESADVVLGPATDGGYWLIGLSSPAPEFFDGPAWGSDTVFQQTMQTAERMGRCVALLDLLSDIDTLDDWNAYTKKAQPAAAGPL